jgi:hypothetical protein
MIVRPLRELVRVFGRCVAAEWAVRYMMLVIHLEIRKIPCFDMDRR